jgi:hypothetical protein
MPAVKALIIRMARDNPSWGRERIQGEPAKLGHRIAKCSVWRILEAAGIDPSPVPRRCGPGRRGGSSRMPGPAP